MAGMITKNAQETIEYAISIATSLHGGEVLALHGDLGGGKTNFTKGLAEGLKVNVGHALNARVPCAESPANQTVKSESMKQSATRAQLHAKLRADPRVKSLERLHATLEQRR